MKATHQALREGTASAHERLDTLFAGFDLTETDGYRRFLLAHADALLPIEAWLDAAGAARVTPDWPQRRRGGLLRQDLADLGQKTVQAVGAPTLPDDAASVAGALYVVEGSRLGGTMLARRVAPGLPTRYLAPETAPGWREALANIDAALYGPPDIDRAIAAALAVFATFEAAGHRGLLRTS